MRTVRLIVPVLLSNNVLISGTSTRLPLIHAQRLQGGPKVPGVVEIILEPVTDSLRSSFAIPQREVLQRR